ncbi:hypothetical protein BI334_09335 [Moorena producens 3L]|nr:hypothetical protein BI334_09335 [Moorena producens 3L]
MHQVIINIINGFVKRALRKYETSLGLRQNYSKKTIASRTLQVDLLSNCKHSAFSIQLSAFSIQLSAFSIQHSAISIQLSAFSIQHSAFSYQP